MGLWRATEVLLPLAGRSASETQMHSVCNGGVIRVRVERSGKGLIPTARTMSDPVDPEGPWEERLGGVIHARVEGTRAWRYGGSCSPGDPPARGGAWAASKTTMRRGG